MENNQIQGIHLLRCFIRSLLFYLLFFIGLLPVSLKAQEMNTGFKHLEKGEFLKAQQFFDGILSEYPTNKTALICYGRATGLVGETQKALDIFNNLDQQYPNDQEILLNKAETFLWMKEPGNAVNVYEKLIQSDSTLFAAWLGIANSFSIEKSYKKAHDAITIALALAPENQQALISRKYIVLGFANYLGAEKYEMDSALSVLQENIKVNPLDQESLRLKVMLLILKKDFKRALKESKTISDSTESTLSQSTINHLMGKNTYALRLAEDALAMDSLKEKSNLLVNLHYFNALLWNNQLRKAGEYLETLKADFRENPKILLAGAQLAIYDSDFKKSALKYQEYLLNDSASFDGNLGLADANHAMQLDRRAYLAAFKTERFYDSQRDVKAFLSKLNQQHSPEVKTKALFNSSSDGSHNKQLSASYAMGLSPELKVGFEYQQKTYYSNLPERPSESVLMTSSASYLVNSWMKLKKVEHPEGNRRTFGTPLFLANADLRISKIQKIAVGYNSEIADFNQALLMRHLKTNHFYLRSNVFLKESGLGNYTELIKSYLSDGNQRNLLFTSVYKSIGKKRYFKAGLNYLNLSFRETKPTDYYSPLSQQQLELFGGFNFSTKSVNKLMVNIESAVGQQWGRVPEILTFRSKLSVSQYFGRCSVKVFGQYSTSGNSSFNGFTYQELGVEMKFLLTGKPIFFKKLTRQFEQEYDK